MDSSSQQQKQDDVMEVPEIHGDLLIELLDASLADENAGGHQQLGLVANVDSRINNDSQKESYDIHAHQDCEDCGLDGGVGILPDFHEYGDARLRSPAPAPYVVFGHDGILELEDPFASTCTGGWYMDGLAMEWGEQQDGFPFEPCYGGVGAVEAGTAEQVYARLPARCGSDNRSRYVVHTCQCST